MATVPLLALLLAAAPAQAQPGPWSPAQEELAPPLLALEERTGTRLAAEGERLVRRGPGAGAGGLELRCTLPGGTGRILQLAPDPAGPVLVVAERGLFVTDAEVDVLDPLELGPGAPPGAIRAVHVDAGRRVWVATESAVGACDPFFFWGRTLAAQAAPPAPGPYDLRGAADGSLLVATSGGTWRYVPDRGAPPAIRSVALDGADVAPGTVLDRAHGATVRVAALAEGAGAPGNGAGGEDGAGAAPGAPGEGGEGGATLRYRLDRHHVWRPVEGELVLADLDPGRRLLELIAVDRDLRRSDPFALVLDVAYPRRYGRAAVAGTAAAAGLCVLSLFGWRARRAGGRAAWWRALLSTGLVLLFGAQTLAALFPHAKGWPFVGFTMYTQHYGEYDLVYDEILAGVRPNGRSFRILEGGLGVAVDSRWQVLGPLVDEGASGGDEVARDYLARFRRRWPASQVVAIQAQARRTRLTAEGPVAVAPLVLRHYREPEAGGG